MPVKVAEEWLNACAGCEISILNTGEALLDLLPLLDFVHIPVLVDHTESQSNDNLIVGADPCVRPRGRKSIRL